MGGRRHKVNLCNFPGGRMTAPWVMLFKYSNDPEYMQSIISDYSARGRGNKLINVSHHNRKHVYHTFTHAGLRGLVHCCANAVGRLCRLACEHGFEIVGGGGHHSAVYGERFISVSSHQCDIT